MVYNYLQLAVFNGYTLNIFIQEVPMKKRLIITALAIMMLTAMIITSVHAAEEAKKSRIPFEFTTDLVINESFSHTDINKNGEEYTHYEWEIYSSYSIVITDPDLGYDDSEINYVQKPIDELCMRFFLDFDWYVDFIDTQAIEEWKNRMQSSSIGFCT